MQKNPNGYTPRPLQTDVTLPDEVLSAVEQIAEQVHEMWAVTKMRSGYVFGEVTDDKAHTHKDLRPYAELTDESKSYDRETALMTLRILYALGYEIRKKDA